MRRTSRLIVVGLALAVSLALAGCGNSTLKAANTSAPGFGTAAKGTITEWCRATTLKPGTRDRRLEALVLI